MYVLSDRYDSQEIYCCDRCSKNMPPANGTTVWALECDDDIGCELCDADDEGKAYVR